MRFLYRINGGQVTGESTRPDAYADVGPANNDPWKSNYYVNVDVDPTNTPDGHGLDPSKIYIPGSDTLRDAIQAEIDNFAVAEAEDETLIAREIAKRMLDVDIQGPSKLMRSLVDILVDEFNILRGWTLDFKAATAGANNLADLKAAVAALPNLPDRTLLLLNTAILNRIDSGTND